MATRGDGGPTARHRASEPRTPRTPPRKPPQPPRRTPRTPRAHRDTLSALGAQRATRFTRWTFAIIADLGWGAGFVSGLVPTDSTTYRAMETALAPVLGAYTGMWPWGLLLVAAGILIPTGNIALGAPIGVFAWAGFAVFNLLYGAWAAPLFLAVAWLHVGMGWYILRDRRRSARSTRGG